ncbi:hypothetical protein PVC01_000116900 [Plasmodium vivax]|uniref:VIR protein n=1 Tax=Plasmodium vivax TaxID=5855 RepID=A0A1G4E9J6_PLAVI|nr:hypothetical protein PVC01_000116900 [Plasmodium vivax]
MANSCDGSHHEYPSYKCYDYLSERLNGAKLSTENQINFQNALNSLEKDRSNKFFEQKNITNLAARIASDGVFMHAGTNRACNYINYKLNESLRSHYDHIYTEDYSIFKKFVKAFYNQRHNNYDTERSCENYIKYLDTDKYDRMKIIYKIYDHYDELKKRPYYYIHYNRVKDLCSNLDSLVRYSNDAINRKIINAESISLIKDLKKIIENDEKTVPYKDKCKLDVLNNMLTEFPNSEVQIPRGDGPASVSNVVSKRDEPHELEPQRRDETNEQAQRQQATKEDAEEDPTSRDETSMELTSRDETAMESASRDLAETVQEQGNQLYGFQAVTYPVINQQLSYDQQVTERSGRRYISQDPEAPTRGTEGVLVKMQGFITDTLGSVEPAPILGVSGGMGALFLLFKYTPVGTFFRGGRGRVRRIPSGFHGQFLGAFPDVQDYYGGNIGYGQMNPLAE